MQLTAKDLGTNIEISWTPPADADYYIFYAEGVRVSNAPAVDKNGVVKKSITFSKGAEPYEVVCVKYSKFDTDIGRYPESVGISAATGVVA